MDPPEEKTRMKNPPVETTEEGKKRLRTNAVNTRFETSDSVKKMGGRVRKTKANLG